MKIITRSGLRCVLILLICAGTSAQTPDLVVQTSHGVLIQSIAFSPNGNLLASGGGDGTIKLWDVQSGRQIRTLTGHPPFKVEEREYWLDTYDPLLNVFEGMDTQGRLNTPHALAFSPDGKTLASGSNARTIIIWDVATGNRLTTIHSPVGIWFVAFSSDGKTLLSQSEQKSEEHSYRYWEVASGNELKNSSPPLSSFRLPWQTPDGKLTVRYSEEETSLKIFDSGGHQVRVLEGHEGGVRRAIFSPGGNILASGGWDRTVRLWNLNGKEQTRVLGKHGSFVSSLAFSADQKILASGSADLTIKLWDVTSGRELRTLRGYSINSFPLAFGRDNGLLLANTGARAHVWDLRKGRKLASARIHKGTIHIVLFSRDRGVFATSDESTAGITAWTRNSTQLDDYRRALKLPNVIFPADVDDWVDYAESDKTIKLWNGDDGTLKKQLGGNAGEITSLAFSYDSKVLASGSEDHTIKLWKLNSEEEPLTLKGHNADVSAVAFNPTGQFLASGDSDGNLKLWNLTTLKEMPLAGNVRGDRIISIVFPADEKSLISFEGALTDLKIRIWDLDSYQLRDAFSFRRSPEKIDQVLNLVPDVFQKMNFPVTDDARFYAVSRPGGRIGLFARDTLSDQTDEARIPLAWLIALGDEDWVVVTPNGQFDTNNLERPEGLNWTFPDTPLQPLSFEIFMRDYYEPRLLPRLLKGETFGQLPSLAALNRIQPNVGKLSIVPQDNKRDLVTVNVEVASTGGQCLKDGQRLPCESGVYDLRLYRDGQLVAQYPQTKAGDAASDLSTQNRQQELAEWRKSSVVKTDEGKPISIATGAQSIRFTNIRLPQRSDVSKVEFTAFAFNRDRVKSVTSEPIFYPLRQPRPGVKRRAFVICVGVDATSDPSLRLGFAPYGARDIEQLLREKLQSQYEVVSVPLISENKQDSADIEQDRATKGNIQAVLNLLSGESGTTTQRQVFSMLRSATPDDLVLLYIASHGYSDPKGKFYIIPSDIGSPEGVSEQLLNRCLQHSEQSASCRAAREFLHHSISTDELTQWLQPIDAGQVVLILDSCHSAAVSGSNFRPGPMGDRGFGQLSYDKGMLVLAATQADNAAWGILDRSLLTYALTDQQLGTGQPFDFSRWLGEAERQVPELYNRYVKNQESTVLETPQEPELFDFTKKRSTIANH
jgi:WD40 repeat protein